ncbi:LptF/LptG family permease [Helicobacter sp. MIT 14-3879]|uniref:LptF/LptG family permease n=1 Tax=Helicobacter sp. MIT 14-3879 TaxID=2040649 RepID=UPI000E1EA7D2|nr:LptF/LptG family permease [Helicobacter sp. MIT 14-3879]RDU63961.1 permease [Helicobacter sp. MIT 14-3879]
MSIFQNSIRNYLFLSFAKLFFIFFIILFFISSIIVLIGIAGVTFVIKISFYDLLWLYLYSLPNSVFFILPITFFATCVLSLSKLSYDYELLVFFSLGISPNKILKVFLPISILISITLLIFSIAIVPLSKSAYRNFINEKKTNIDVNIKSGEFGQKLGDWLVYVDDVKDREYKNLVLFSSKGLELESFILAKNGKANNIDSIFEIDLFDGIAYFAESYNIKEVIFENMIVRNKIGEVELSSYDLLNYWKEAFNKEPNKLTRIFSQSVLISLFPLFSIFLLPLFGVSNPRFHKNFSYLYIIVSIIFFYTLVYFVMNNIPLLGIPILLAFWIIVSYILYRRFILKYY